jgi:ribosomal protein S18 acetylase RimI-like enzyme
MVGSHVDQTITIRRALVADAPTAHAVLLSAKEAIPLADNFADDRHKECVRERCGKKKVWLAEMGGEVAGVMVIAVDEIFYLVTAPTHLRKGVARALLRRAVQIIQRRYGRRSRVTAKVREDRLPGRWTYGPCAICTA